MTDAGGPWGDRRGQSETIGFVLLIAIAAIGITGIVVLGSAAVDDSRHSMEVGSAEHAMTEFDSRVSLVAHGDSSSQIATLPDGRGQSVQTVPDAGNLTLSIYNETDGTNETLLSTSLGAVAYENGDTTIAYQGGGVWKQSGDGVSSMVSPPEVHYQGTTLTLPLVLVNGAGAITGQAQVTQNGTANAVFPTADRSNPLERGVVTLEVESDYYEAWGRYFEQRMAGDVTVDDPNETARVNLTVPFDGAFEEPLALTGSTRPGNVNGLDDDDIETGENHPSPDPVIVDAIEDCEEDGCDESKPSTITSPGTYYWNGDLDAVDVDDPGGNVTIVVDGSLTPSGSTLDVDDLDDDETVTTYVRDDFGGKGGWSVNEGGNAADLNILIHSSGEMNLGGNPSVTAFVYAPESSCDMHGNFEFKGALVCESMEKGNGQGGNGPAGNAHHFEPEPAIETVDLGLETDSGRITYLHVSVSNVTATQD